GQASEIGADPGVFRLSRTGPTDQALSIRVFHSILNNYAAEQADFTVSTRTASSTSPFVPGAVRFPAGEASLDLIFTPVADNWTEGNERIQLQVHWALAGEPDYTFDESWPKPSIPIGDAAGAQEITLETTDPVGSEV